MKWHLFFVFVLLSGCTHIAQDNSCYDNDPQYIKKILSEEFMLSADQYTVIASQCELARGGYVQADLQMADGQQIHVLYDWGWCSSSGASCETTVCIDAPLDSLVYSQAIQYQCSTVHSYEQNKTVDSTCPVHDAWDNTTQARQECLGYGQIQDDRITFSMILDTDRCSSRIKKGLYDCSST